jgi:hypothetical protein
MADLMCLHVLFSFQRTGLPACESAPQHGIQATACPRLVGSPKTGVLTVFRGTFLHY